MPRDSRDSPPPSNGLIGVGEPRPAVVENRDAGSPFLFVGDHAGHAVPRSLSGLGLAPADFERHIACDLGVEGVGLGLAARLGATFIHQSYSRLLIDCNRAPGAADSIVEVSDGVAIPGNMGLAAADSEARRRGVFDPYHACIARTLDARLARGLTTLLVSLHSFTPVMDGLFRPWRVGVLHQGDSAFSAAMLAVLRRSLDEAVGDNRPYAMDRNDYTVPHHRRGRAIDYLELEIRQDLISAADDQVKMASWLAGQLRRALARA